MVGTATVVGLWGLFLVWLSEPFNPWYFLAYAGPVFVAQAVFTYQRDRIDATLFAPAVLLSGMGLIMVARLAPQLLGRQLCAYLLGLVGFGCLSLFGAKMPLKKMGRPLGLLGAGLLFVTALFGVQAGGSRAWLHFSSFTFQPTELFKLLLILYLVAHVSKEGTPVVLRDRRGFFSYRDLWGPPFGLWLCSLLALGLQRDLGGVLLISGIFWGMLYLVDGRWTTLLAGGALGFVGLLLATYLFPHGRTRLADWLSLWRGEGIYHQLLQGFYAAAAGGFTGTGLGLGQPHFIPQVHTDFVLMALWEELGLLGVVGLLGTYVLMLTYLYKRALRAQRGQERLLCAGVALMLGLQILCIVGGNLGLLPLTGITLPFVSYGGSSLVVLWCALGLVAAHPGGNRRWQEQSRV